MTLHGPDWHREEIIACLAVAQSQLAGLEVQVVPAQAGDFVAPASGQHEETDSRRRIGGGQTFGGCRPERLAEPASSSRVRKRSCFSTLKRKTPRPMILAGAARTNALPVLTFDRKMARFAEARVVSPTGP